MYLAIYMCAYRELTLDGNLEKSHSSTLGIMNHVKHCLKCYGLDVTTIVMNK